MSVLADQELFNDIQAFLATSSGKRDILFPKRTRRSDDRQGCWTPEELFLRDFFNNNAASGSEHVSRKELPITQLNDLVFMFPQSTDQTFFLQKEGIASYRHAVRIKPSRDLPPVQIIFHAFHRPDSEIFFHFGMEFDISTLVYEELIEELPNDPYRYKVSNTKFSDLLETLFFSFCLPLRDRSGPLYTGGIKLSQQGDENFETLPFKFSTRINNRLFPSQNISFVEEQMPQLNGSFYQARY